MNPALYDFKRSFFRISTISFVILFSVIGIGVTYEAVSFTHSFYASNYTDINYVAVITNSSRNNYVAIVYVFNNLGNPISNAKVNILGKVNTTNSSGYALLSGVPESGVIEVSYNGKTVSENYSSIGVFDDSSEFVASQGSLPILTNRPFYIYFVITIPQNGRADLVLATPEKNVTVAYSFYGSYSGKLLLRNYINVFNIAVPNKGTSFSLSVRNSLEYSNVSLSYNPTNNVISNYESFFILLNIIPIVGFPILIVSLVYDFLVRPRSSGALLFLLSKPITRREIYLSRFFAGSLVALVSALAFSITAYGVVDYFAVTSARVPTPLSFFLLEFTSLSVGLVTFYSLLLMFPTLIKNSGTNLSIYVLFYLGDILLSGILLLLILGLYKFPVSETLIYDAIYSNPIGLESALTYLLYKQYIAEPSYSWITPGLVTLGIIASLVIPIVIGLWRIQKVNI